MLARAVCHSGYLVSRSGGPEQEVRRELAAINGRNTREELVSRQEQEKPHGLLARHLRLLLLLSHTLLCSPLSLSLSGTQQVRILFVAFFTKQRIVCDVQNTLTPSRPFVYSYILGELDAACPSQKKKKKRCVAGATSTDTRCPVVGDGPTPREREDRDSDGDGLLKGMFMIYIRGGSYLCLIYSFFYMSFYRFGYLSNY